MLWLPLPGDSMRKSRPPETEHESRASLILDPISPEIQRRGDKPGTWTVDVAISFWHPATCQDFT